MTTSHYKPGGNSKARRRRIRALEEVWGEFADKWLVVAQLRGCTYVSMMAEPHEAFFAHARISERNRFLTQLHNYGDQSIKALQASTEIVGSRSNSFLRVRLQRPGYRQDGSRDLGVREETESKAGEEGVGAGAKVFAAFGMGQRHQEVRPGTSRSCFDSWQARNRIRD